MARTLTRLVSAIVLAWLAVLPRAAWGQLPRVMPNEISPQVVQRVKQGTVYIKVLDGESIASGSGFLAIEPGVVVTNAHVIGMLEKNSKPPAKIEVYVNSGEPNEIQLDAKVVAVDRAVDLAVLRIDCKVQPLPLDLTYGLYETQKLYIFGFPLGERLGKNVTVSESSVSALRKDSTGQLQKVQVNGGMQPGNSGGPVVNSYGQVVGVSVSVIRGTQINFAIPVAKVQALMGGKLDEVRAGEIFRQEEEVRVPLKCTTIDPLKRIREIRVEVWAGKPSDKYPFSPKQAQTLPKDAVRKTYRMKYEDGIAALDVPLPKLAEGQVAWVQPVLAYAKELRWTTPRSFDVSQAVERLAADLIVKLSEQQRTVHLKTALNVSQGRDRLSTKMAELDVLESLSSDARGAIMKTCVGSLKTTEKKGETNVAAPEGTKLISKSGPVYLVDPTNKLRKKYQNPINVKLNPEQTKELKSLYGLILLSYEVSNFVLPNKQMEAGDTWQAASPVVLVPANIPVEDPGLDMTVTYTYEGLRTRAGKSEALVSFEAGVKDSNKRKDELDLGQVVGKFTFDPDQGFITTVNMSITPDIAELDIAINIELTRVEGNPKSIELPNVDDAVVKKSWVYSLADVQTHLKKLAPIKIENAHFISIKDGKDGNRKIFGEVPPWLKERTFHFAEKKGEATQFTVEADGVVLMAVSPRFRMGQPLVAPGTGVFGNVKEPWFFDCKSKYELIREGWLECGAVPVMGLDWPLYFRECKKGETFQVRTEKELAPIIIK